VYEKVPVFQGPFYLQNQITLYYIRGLVLLSILYKST
jgi:hypothetical protein